MNQLRVTLASLEQTKLLKHSYYYISLILSGIHSLMNSQRPI